MYRFTVRAESPQSIQTAKGGGGGKGQIKEDKGVRQEVSECAKLTYLFATATSPDDCDAAAETGICGAHSVALYNTHYSSNDCCGIITVQII